MFKYGIELEGFRHANYQGAKGVGTDAITVPDASDPVDGFPGLVELRSVGGHHSLADAMGQVEAARLRLASIGRVEFFTHCHKFTAEQMAFMRKNRRFQKEPLAVGNVYGKAPRRLGNLTLASCQINISKEIASEYTDKEGKKFGARYALFDFYPLIKLFDQEFTKEIKDSNRQPGMYAIKDDYRLEYRSLPNFAYWNDFYSRVLKVMSEYRKG